MKTAKRKVYEIINNKVGATGVTVDGREMRFGKSGGFRITDPSLANDIEKTVGKGGTRDVVVVPCDGTVETGHDYTFRMPGRTWKSNPGTSKYEWVEVSPGKHKMVKKE